MNFAYSLLEREVGAYELCVTKNYRRISLAHFNAV